jgi:ABC-2 type transport system ATP-binding protein
MINLSGGIDRMPAATGDPVLETIHLSKRYGALLAVDDLSLQVQQGEIFGFLGPNGAGKTTSIHMMCGLLRPDAGEVRIHGRALRDGDPELRALVGVCPQSTVLWGKLTCLEQLEFSGEMYGLPRRVGRQRAMQLLETLGLAEKRHKLAASLSGGMQRRLNLALALVHAPRILVLDEPEAGLDPQSRVLVREYVRAWARQEGRTVILTTHNMDEAERMSDRVAIIDRGRLLVVDTPEALKRRLGEGDVLEIELRTGGGLALEQAVEVAVPFVLQASLVGPALVLRDRSMVEKITALTQALHGAGFQTGELRLRANTLEDVFISLTGRRLRE